MTFHQTTTGSTRRVMAAALFAAVITVACSSDTQESNIQEQEDPLTPEVTQTSITTSLEQFIATHGQPRERAAATFLHLRLIEGEPERTGIEAPEDSSVVAILTSWQQDDGTLQHTLDVNLADRCQTDSGGLFIERSPETGVFSNQQRPEKGGFDLDTVDCGPQADVGFDYLFNTELDITTEDDTITLTTPNNRTVVLKITAPPPVGEDLWSSARPETTSNTETAVE